MTNPNTTITRLRRFKMKTGIDNPDADIVNMMYEDQKTVVNMLSDYFRLTEKYGDLEERLATVKTIERLANADIEDVLKLVKTGVLKEM